MLKKISCILLIFILVTSVVFGNTNKVSANGKVMWGKTELKDGQIGKVTIISKTTLWKIDTNNTLIKIRDLKKGEEYRTYSYKNNNGGLYGVGGGSFIQKSEDIMYETPSKSKLSLLEKINKNNNQKPSEIPNITESILTLNSAIDGTNHVFYLKEDNPLNKRLIAYNKTTGKNVYIPVNDDKILKSGGLANEVVSKDYAFLVNFEDEKLLTYRMSLKPPFKIEKVFEDIYQFVVLNEKLYFFEKAGIDPVTNKLNLMVSNIDGSNLQIFAELEDNYSPSFFAATNNQIVLQRSDNNRADYSFNTFNLDKKEIKGIDKNIVSTGIKNPHTRVKFGINRDSRKPLLTEVYSTTHKVAEVKMEGKVINFVTQYNGTTYLTLSGEKGNQLFKVEGNELKHFDTAKGDIIWLEGNKYYYFNEKSKSIEEEVF